MCFSIPDASTWTVLFRTSTHYCHLVTPDRISRGFGPVRKHGMNWDKGSLDKGMTSQLKQVSDFCLPSYLWNKNSRDANQYTIKTYHLTGENWYLDVGCFIFIFLLIPSLYLYKELPALLVLENGVSEKMKSMP